MRVTSSEDKVTPEVATEAKEVSLSTKGDNIMPQRTDAPVLTNALKVAGEGLIVPGASLVVDGDLKGGAIHIAGAYVARALIGPIGWALVAADSYSVSVSGKHLHQHFFGGSSS